MKVAHISFLATPYVPQLAVPTHRLDPHEDFLHALAYPLTNPVTIMPGGPCVDGRVLLLRHMGRVSMSRHSLTKSFVP